MAALPPPLDFSRQRGRAAGIGAMVLGVVVAVDVALLFIVVMGADRGQWAGASYHARPNPGEIQAARAAGSSKAPRARDAPGRMAPGRGPRDQWGRS